jgi:hypothetical protein
MMVKEFYGTRYQSGFLFLNHFGSGFHCLRSSSFLFYNNKEAGVGLHEYFEKGS